MFTHQQKLLLHDSPWQQSSDAQLSPEAAQRGVFAVALSALSYSSSLTPGGKRLNVACVRNLKPVGTSVGSVWCWDRELTAVRADWDGKARSITKGYYQVCLVDDDHALHCWGHEIPAAQGPTCLGCAPILIDTASAVAQASGGFEITWLRTLDGRVRSLTEASLGPELQLPAAAVDISAGDVTACAVLEDGTIQCWANPGWEGREGSWSFLMGLGTEPSEVRLCNAEQ